MSIHSFHLLRLPPWVTAAAMVRPPRAAGLLHLEVMAGMALGSPVFSPRRMQLSRVALFAEWESEQALDAFLSEHRWGARPRDGWHVRLQFVRRWGSAREQAHLPQAATRTHPDEPVVAITLARLRLPELPRFISWGCPVERQVRDHPATTLALAAMCPPRTLSTFSIWTSARAMTDMVTGADAGVGVGRDGGAGSGPHRAAMAERERRDFHHEFTTLRFRALSEHGTWEGRRDYVPTAR